MENYRKSSHATYRYHFVWIPKYRYRILLEEVRPRLRDILFQLCEWKGIILLGGSICSDHVHMHLSVPPIMSPSYIIKILKGKSAELLSREFPKIRKRCWGRHVWARGYFVSTVGINSEVTKKRKNKFEKIS